MRLRIGPAPVLAATVALVFAVACGAAATPAPMPASQSQSPTPTPLSPEARQTAMEFVRRHRAVEQDWDQFHSDFDRWRGGLVSCEPSSAQVALRGFAGDFSEILRQARNLPRPAATRDVADQLIAAAEGEGEALRRLRDDWQPADTSLFNAVESQRSTSAAAQQEALDKLNDLGEGSNPEATAQAREFSNAFGPVSEDWEMFHASYNSFRDQQGDLTPVDTTSRLDGLVNTFSSIVSAVDNLPSSGATEEMAGSLKEAADAEDQALKDLRDHFQSEADPSSGASQGEPASNGEASTPTPAGTPSSSATDPFGVMNGLVQRSNAAREQVQRDLDSILRDAAAQEVDAINNFRQQYDVLVREWDRFHQEYDEWRRTEGGCNRTEVIDQLGQFSVRFGEIATRVRNLPTASFVRPMGDTLAEAAQREEEALRVLRNTWRPFTTDAYRALDQERTNASSLRRQAGTGVQEMVERFGISASES